eukprot:bmy_21580T0
MFIYSNNRLIKMHEKVGPQLKLKSLLGAGVVGIVDIPLEIMEPSHNKQEFLNVQEYNHLLKVMGQYLVHYCKDTGIRLEDALTKDVPLEGKQRVEKGQ